MRTTHMGCDRITRKVMLNDRYHLTPNGWPANLEAICKSVGMEECWNNLNPVNIVESRKQLLRWYGLAWKEEVESKSKLDTYAEIKQDISVEPYLLMDLNKYKRSLICQLRTGTLSLEIENGRHKNVPHNQRICKLCTEAVETELHFLFDCVKLSKTRLEYYHKVPEILTFSENVHKLKYLNSKPYLLGIFLCDLWQKRLELQIGNVNESM